MHQTRTPHIMLISVGLALLAPMLAFGTAQAATGTSAPVVSTAVQDASPMKRKSPKGMSTKRLIKLIDAQLRGDFYRDCEVDPGCDLTLDWSKVKWRGSAKHCIAGQNYGDCERWATAYVARADLLVTETQQADVLGKLDIEMTQYGYWDNGLKIVSYTDGYGAKEAWCSTGCGRSLLVWRDEFKDWFYSFSDIGDCCSAYRLT